jgi:uncharacterized repeat protein (TIGR03803 family)
LTPDGANPWAALTLAPDGNLYGTTRRGANGSGSVFRLTTNGLFSTLVSLSPDQGGPNAPLVLGNNDTFYGTTENGLLFNVTTNGVLTPLTNISGLKAGGLSGLTLGDDGSFYGTASSGGTSNCGMVFRFPTNSPLALVASFGFTNGQLPLSGLTAAGNGSFYGTTHSGGSTNQSAANFGVIFNVTTNGILTLVAAFANTNGAYPYSGLTFGPDGNLYGATACGGIGMGNLFRATTNGQVSGLVMFNGPNGQSPTSNLLLGKDGNFYGTTDGGGIGGGGIVFKLATNGLMTTLASFAGSNGASPNALALGPDGNFYGTTKGGGGANYGTVFTLVFPLQFTQDTDGSRADNGVWHGRLMGPPSATVVVESSTDLTHWAPFSTNTLPSADAGGADVSFPTAGNDRLFFRARQR